MYGNIAAMAEAQHTRDREQHLSEIAHITELLEQSTQPVFHISRSAPHLLGVSRWVPQLFYVNLRDNWNGTNPSVFTPNVIPRVEPSGLEIINWLLANAEVQSFIAEKTPPGKRPQVIFSAYDERAEQLCDDLGYEIILPRLELRNRLDSKIKTTQMCEAAGVPNVPNILTTAGSWAELTAETVAAGIGNDLVIQTAYGEGGFGTYFISDEDSYNAVFQEFRGRNVKAMKRIDHRPLSIEAVIMRAGIVVGPLQHDMVGHEELTLHEGGTSGLEMFAEVLDDENRSKLINMVRTFGEQLQAEGYRGIYEVDLLLDEATGDLYFGETNPRVNGAAMITNVSSVEFFGLPLYALHILEYAGVDYSLDVEALNAHWDQLEECGTWTQVTLRHVSQTAEKIHEVPQTGRYRLGANGSLTFVSADLDWFDLEEADEIFYLQYRQPGDMRAHGDELGLLFVRNRMQNDNGELLTEAQRLISAVHALYDTTPLSTAERAVASISRRVRALTSKLRQPRRV